MDETIRRLLAQHTKLRVQIDKISDRADLFDAGLDSLAMVNLMIALEDAFAIELPESMLSRGTFATIAALRQCVTTLQSTAASA